MEYDEYFCKKPIAEITSTGEPQVLIFASFTACGWLCVLQRVNADRFLQAKQTTIGRKWLLLSPDVRKEGTRDESLRTFALLNSNFDKLFL